MLKITTLSIALAMAAAFSVPSQGGEPSCGVDPSCGACSACGNACCPQCGCHEGLVPVCHQYWETKKVTEYCYKCVCKEICLPGRCGAHNDGLFGDHCCKDGCGCQESCGCKENCGCNNGACCDCRYREVHTLVKCPVTKEICVRKCKIDWVCPHCHCDCGCETGAAPGTPSTPPMPPASPTAGKTTATDLAPSPASAVRPASATTAFAY